MGALKRVREREESLRTDIWAMCHEVWVGIPCVMALSVNTQEQGLQSRSRLESSSAAHYLFDLEQVISPLRTLGFHTCKM